MFKKMLNKKKKECEMTPAMKCVAKKVAKGETAILTCQELLDRLKLLDYRLNNVEKNLDHGH